MAATLPGFPAAAFRAGIRTAMGLGMPVEEARRPEFVIEAPAVADPATADASGVPWDLNVVAPTVETTRVRPLCVIETAAEANTDGRFGQLQPGSIVVTLLDEEYALVKGFSYVNLWLAAQAEPVPYFYNKVLAQPNLDVVGVWQLECRTEDQV